jgi:type I restriction enzyme R subunit
LLPHAIETKTRIMLDHFLDKTVHEIQGRARAMVVTRSRLHAVKFYLAFQKIMAERGLGFKPLVAFSGEVKDPETGQKYTETGLNHLPPKVSIPDAFKTPDYRLLVVANKFQTGFDEPLLHTMYVDKRLAGVQAVQTLSRLNRTRPGKNETLVLDFVNEADEIQLAFQPYYQTTLLEEETDPNLLYTLQAELDAFEVFTAKDMRDFAELFFTPQIPREKWQPVLDRVKIIWDYKPEEQREAFRAALQKFIRLYGFLSQLITFADVELEELYVFARALNHKLPRRENRLPYEVQDAVDLDSFRIQETYTGSLELQKADGLVGGFSDGMKYTTEDEKDFLSHIVALLNETYGLNMGAEDKVDFGNMLTKYITDDELRTVMAADNPRDAKKYKSDQVIDQLFLAFVHTKLDLYKKLTDPKTNELIKRMWFEKFVLEMGKA